jgi:hypothetical protein
MCGNRWKSQDTTAAMLTEILLLPDVSHSHLGTFVARNSDRISVDKVAQPKRKVYRGCRQWTQRTGDQKHRHRALCLRLRPNLECFSCIVFVLVSKSARVTCPDPMQYAKHAGNQQYSASRCPRSACPPTSAPVRECEVSTYALASPATARRDLSIADAVP